MTPGGDLKMATHPLTDLPLRSGFTSLFLESEWILWLLCQKEYCISKAVPVSRLRSSKNGSFLLLSLGRLMFGTSLPCCEEAQTAQREIWVERLQGPFFISLKLTKMQNRSLLCITDEKNEEQDVEVTCLRLLLGSGRFQLWTLVVSYTLFLFCGYPLRLK